VAKAPKVDVFYLHPTTFRSSDGQTNADLADAKANLWVDESVVSRQASVFTGCCRVFAPRYRAATFNAFSDPEKQKAAFALAYTDVERAFDYFLQHRSKGRPFIVAGHSQGAFHAATLLEKQIEGTPLQRRLVAAYIVGINLSEGDFGRRFKRVQPCITPRQTGCVLQWEAILEGSDVTTAEKRAQSTFVANYGDLPGKQTVCINPLTFDARKPQGEAKASLGAVPGDPGFGAMRPLVAGKVSARCEQGLLVTRFDPSLELKPLPGGSLHFHDFGLFWADIRADAQRRAKAHRR
jgi:pimeloyl-ACP methyl ester carboxylesterase